MSSRLLYAFLLFLLASFSLVAETADKPRYRLQCGDRLHLLVYGDPSTKRIVLVDPSGNINYLYAKNIPVRGKTIAEVRDILTQKMGTYYKDPLLMVTLTECLGEYYSIIGEVIEPGYKKIEGNPTLLSALCEAKGFTTRLFRDQTVDQADLSKSFMIREGQYLPIDFEALVIHGDVSQDVALKNGDYIYITPTGLKKVFVLGEVGSPAPIEYLHDTTLSRAIAEVGGLNSSASSRVVVIRGSLTLPIRFLIDINRILKGKALDFPLEPGDIVYVPPMRFAVLKEIVKQGIAGFVSIVASIAGAATYVSIQPKAAGDALIGVLDAIDTTTVAPIP